jgi:hypothetical protein
MFDDEFTQVHLAMQHRLNLEFHRQFVDLQKRCFICALGSMHRDVIEMSGERGKTEIQAADRSGYAHGLLH